MHLKQGESALLQSSLLFRWLWNTETQIAGISAHRQTDRMPAADDLCFLMLGSLQPGVPAALPSFKKDSCWAGDVC